jgi:hypothetical protein
MSENSKEFSVICDGMRVRIAMAAVLMAVAVLRLGAQEQLPRISLSDSRLKIVRVVQAEPVAGAYANSVTADIVIGVGRHSRIRGGAGGSEGATCVGSCCLEAVSVCASGD